MLVKPWGVVLLALLGALGLAGLLTGGVLSWLALHKIHATLGLTDQLRAAIDTVAALQCRVR
jgi:hypothetical protein